jgi:nucleoside-diphosphate-sugar epimerase
VALGRSTSLSDLHTTIATRVSAVTGKAVPPVCHGVPRPGDIRHSAADISLIRGTLGFEPTISIDAGLEETVAWYAANG